MTFDVSYLYLFVAVAEWLCIGLQIRSTEVQFLPATPSTYHGGCSSVVLERLVVAQKDVGSIPINRPILTSTVYLDYQLFVGNTCLMAAHPADCFHP